MLRVYHIERTDGYSYDEYSDAVVVANSEQEAQRIIPEEELKWVGDKLYERNSYLKTDWKEQETYGSGDYYLMGWTTPDKVEVKLIGKLTNGSYKAGDVICSSFHAG